MLSDNKIAAHDWVVEPDRGAGYARPRAARNERMSAMMTSA